MFHRSFGVPSISDGLDMGDRVSRRLGAGDELGGRGPLQDRASVADIVRTCRLLGKDTVD